ncbi:putative LRR receptor-like serine/threonine-protein kinase [Planoprotostelium fungivorum]|uniref:Putative LRR receptor-like serine/threonine-protein kinase n=1 Tax=Planoprotostelium fungivorum TaxID=1890364 RepID=A0A2P6NSC6_9EUKA|nr:putative LRR receptor-like serine/threonine-protein kinase [Planoprotostelium fungivorum]
MPCYRSSGDADNSHCALCPAGSRHSCVQNLTMSSTSVTFLTWQTYDVNGKITAWTKMKRAALLLTLFLTVSAVLLPLNGNIQAVVDSTLSGVSSGDVYFDLSSESVYTNQSLSISNFPLVNLFFSGDGSSTFNTPRFSFSNIGSVTFTDINFEGSSQGPMISVTSGGAFNLSSCTFSSVYDGSSLLTTNITSVSINQCTFESIYNTNGAGNVVIQTGTKNVSLTNTQFLNSEPSLTLFSVEYIDSQAHIIINNVTLNSIHTVSLSGFIDLRSNCDLFSINGSSFIDAIVNYGIVKVSEGVISRFIITNSQFSTSTGFSLIYFDWYSSIDNIVLDGITFSQGLPIVGSYIGILPVSSALIMISGTHGNLTITNSIARNCLMGSDAAFISVMFTYGEADVRNVLIDNVVALQNQLTPIMFNSATVGSVIIRRSTLQFNSAITTQSHTIGGAMTVVGSTIDSMSILDSDVSYNNGPCGGLYIEDTIYSLLLDNVTGVYNSATSLGGMVRLDATEGNTLVVFNNSVFYSNIAATGAGAIIIESFLPGSGIYNCRFEFNTITGGSSQGGAIILDNANLDTNLFTIDNCVFRSNSATYGSAFSSRSRYRLTNSSFSGHPPSQTVILDQADYVFVSGNTFSDLYIATTDSLGMHYSEMNMGNHKNSSSYTFIYNTMSSTWNHQLVFLDIDSTASQYIFSNNVIPTAISSNNVVMIANYVPLVDIMIIEDNKMPGLSPSVFTQAQDSLKFLSLKGNALKTSPVTLSTYPPNLLYLDLSHNLLTDRVAIPYSSMDSLQALFINDNLFTNSSVFRSMPSNLTHLDVSGNNYTGSITAFSSINQLQTLRLDRNGFSGDIKPLTQLTSLTSLNASFNSLNSAIPSNFSLLSQLSSLDLSYNSIYGDVPNLVNLTSLVHLDLSHNALNGSINGLLNVRSLIDLDVSSNSIRGNLSSLNGMSNLQHLNVSYNAMDLAGVNFTSMSSSLVTLDVNYCQLSGSLPPSFNGLSRLEFATMIGNQITSFSSSQTDLPSLRRLYLSDNALSSSVDLSLYQNMSSLQVLLIDGNRYTGGLELLNNMSSLIVLNASYNQISSGASLLPSFPVLQIMDVSHNALTGDISSIGISSHLQYLDLSDNQLNGTIGSSFNAMNSLTYLNASHNNVTGDIILSLPQLTTCDLSHNSYVCPINWKAYDLCSISCSTDSTLNATIRIRFVGDVSLFNETNFLKSLAQMTNISMNRISIFNLLSGSVITDLLISPPSPLDVNQGSAPYVVQYLRSASSSEYSRNGIALLDVSDVPPITSSSTFTQVQSTGTPSDNIVTTRDVISGGALIGIIVGAVILALILVVIVAFLLYNRSVQSRRRRREEENNIQLQEEGTVYGIIDRDQLSSSRGLLDQGTVESLSQEKAKLIKMIGEGAYGVVYMASYQGKIVAMKQIKTVSMEIVESFMSEVELMKRLQPHPNVVSFLGFCARPLALITEFMAGGSLDDYLNRNPNLSIMKRMTIIQGVAEGMAHLAQERVLHKDLAARNVLLTEDLLPKVSDFGLSRILDVEADVHQSKTDVGPIKWMAPESLRGKFSEKSDVWAWGVLCIEVFTGNQPFPNMSPTDFLVGVANDHLHEKMLQQIPDTVEVDVKFLQLLEDVFHPDPVERPTFTKIVAAIKSLDEPY